MAYLETKGLTVGYHGKPLIEDVALHVQRGKIVTLIGPNGSGKSTILKTIIGQLSKVSGTVFLDGKDMEDRSRNEIARRMAILMTARSRCGCAPPWPFHPETPCRTPWRAGR